MTRLFSWVPKIRFARRADRRGNEREKRRQVRRTAESEDSMQRPNGNDKECHIDIHYNLFHFSPSLALNTRGERGLQWPQWSEEVGSISLAPWRRGVRTDTEWIS